MSDAPVLVTRPEQALRLPLVCDSPHSGTHYPSDFGSVLTLQQLRQTEDTDIDALWSATPQVGGTLLAARFPRCYIDPNRDLNDLDPALLAEAWPAPLSPGPKSQLGYGLVFSKVNANTLIYDRALTVHEVQQRIAHCWQPYRNALDQEVQWACETFGGVWHLNLHSMPQNAYERLGLGTDKVLADFVLGDRDGSTCEPEFVDMIEQSLRRWGYSVARNDPYKGVALLAQVGQPRLNRHSLQIEIRRPLYMNEATRERNSGFETLQKNMSRTLADVAAYVKSKVQDHQKHTT
jgi:N-formylglutamate deformylase